MGMPKLPAGTRLSKGWDGLDTYGRVSCGAAVLRVVAAFLGVGPARSSCGGAAGSALGGCQPPVCVWLTAVPGSAGEGRARRLLRVARRYGSIVSSAVVLQKKRRVK